MQELPGERAAQPGKRPGSYSSATKLEGGFHQWFPHGEPMTVHGMAQARANPGVAIEAISMVEIAPVELCPASGKRRVEVMTLLEVMTLRLE